MLDVKTTEIDLYNIILNRNTREWERTQFEDGKRRPSKNVDKAGDRKTRGQLASASTTR